MNIEKKYGNSGESLLSLHSEAYVKEKNIVAKEIVSRFKRAFQSTLVLPATWALDTNQDTFSQTEDEDNPWWMVDLGVVVRSTNVKVYVRGNLFSTYEVFLTMKKPKEPRNIPIKNRCKMVTSFFKVFTVKTHDTFDCPSKGKFVTVKLSLKKNSLMLKEVEVSGEPLKYCTDSLNPCDEATTDCVIVDPPLYFGCKCKEGYTKFNSSYQVSCVKEEHVCDDKLLNPCEQYSTTCVKLTSESYFKCKCNDGFIPVQEDSQKRSKVRCMKNDVCEGNDCDQSNSICVKSQYSDSYECQCREGFKNELISNNPETYSCVESDHPCFTHNHTCGPDTKCIPVNNFPDYECVTKSMQEL